jgi:septal ring factor EnvC (AmiA/AmiB activator)
MSLLLVNAISAVLSLGAIAVVVVALRKAAEMIRLSRMIAGEIAAASAGLEKALAALKSEHDDLRDEGRKLNARLQESARAQREITRSLDLMERIRAELQGDVRALRTSIASRPAPAAAPEPARPTVQAKPSKLPVFVHRVHSGASTIGTARS